MYRSVLMLDSEEGGVERTKISMRSYFIFCLHLHYTMKLWTFEQSRWAKGMLLDLASHIATTDMCQFKIASSKLCQIFCGWHSAGKIPWSPMDHICQSWRLQGRIARPLWIIHPWFNVCLAQGHEGSRARVWSNLLSEKGLVRKGCLLVKRV